jgi:hypothetical protein
MFNSKLIKSNHRVLRKDNVETTYGETDYNTTNCFPAKIYIFKRTLSKSDLNASNSVFNYVVNRNSGGDLCFKCQ